MATSARQRPAAARTRPLNDAMQKLGDMMGKERSPDGQDHAPEATAMAIPRMAGRRAWPNSRSQLRQQLDNAMQGPEPQAGQQAGSGRQGDGQGPAVAGPEEPGQCRQRGKERAGCDAPGAPTRWPRKCRTTRTARRARNDAIRWAVRAAPRAMTSRFPALSDLARARANPAGIAQAAPANAPGRSRNWIITTGC